MTFKTRPMTIDDIPAIKNIHDRDFPHLEFPDFTKMLSAFVIEDTNGDMVMAGSVKLISEALLVTNKDMSRIKIGKALVIAQGACIHTAQAFNIKEVYAFTDNDDYAKHLRLHGFHERDDRALLMRF